jgi:Cu/Ag efflux pump CusA
VEIKPTPNVVHREAASRSIDVGANVRGRDLGWVVRQLKSGLQNVKFPLQYDAELLGEYAERQATQGRLLGFAVGAAFGVFCLLLAAFRNWRLACLSFFTLPSALERRAGLLPGWRHHLHRLARGLLHDPGHRGAQWDHIDQPLSAS